MGEAQCVEARVRKGTRDDSIRGEGEAVAAHRVVRRPTPLAFARFSTSSSCDIEYLVMNNFSDDSHVPETLSHRKSYASNRLERPPCCGRQAVTATRCCDAPF